MNNFKTVFLFSNYTDKQFLFVLLAVESALVILLILSSLGLLGGNHPKSGLLRTARRLSELLPEPAPNTPGNLSFVNRWQAAVNNTYNTREADSIPEQKRLIFILMFLAAMVFLPLHLFVAPSMAKNTCEPFQAMYDSQQYKIAEGLVQVLYKAPFWGTDVKSKRGDIIKIGNVQFRVNQGKTVCGYSQDISHGGVLTEKTYVRVFYVKTAGFLAPYTILRIDVLK